MKSIIDEALETGHNRFDRGGPDRRRKDEHDEDGDNKNVRNLPLVPSKAPVEKQEGVSEIDTKQDIKDDYTNARAISYSLIEQQQQLIKGMIEFLNACPSPRAYEVVNQMMKTATDMTERLLGVQNQLKEAQEESRRASGEGKGGDTFIFQGGPTAILKQLKKAEEAEKRIIDVTPE